jgi:predicted nucleic acid-binding protein
MLVVSNTSPISNLTVIDRLALLRERYGRVIIPPVVREELHALPHTEGKKRMETAIGDDWLAIQSLPDEARTFLLPGQLDPGETEIRSC